MGEWSRQGMHKGFLASGVSMCSLQEGRSPQAEEHM